MGEMNNNPNLALTTKGQYQPQEIELIIKLVWFNVNRWMYQKNERGLGGWGSILLRCLRG